MEKNEMNGEMSGQVMENEQKSVKNLEMHVEAPIGSMNVSVNAQGVKTEMQETDTESAQEVKEEVQETDTSSMSASTSTNYKSWFGLSANITGSVSSDSSHKRETDGTATYKIHARAAQQPPSEGMEKMTSLFAQAMEPIPKSTS